MSCTPKIPRLFPCIRKAHFSHIGQPKERLHNNHKPLISALVPVRWVGKERRSAHNIDLDLRTILERNGPFVLDLGLQVMKNGSKNNGIVFYFFLVFKLYCCVALFCFL